MTNQFTEDNLIEKTTIDLFASLWWKENFVNAFTKEGEERLQRKNTWEVVLVKYLQEAIAKLNPWISQNTVTQVLDIFTTDRSTKSLEQANKEVYEMMKNGIKVEILKDSWEYETKNVVIMDWDNPSNNSFLLVSQLWIAGDLYTRRPDLIWFVNGIPLILIELKSPSKNLFDAYNDNLRDYKDTVPQLFWYNATIILSNGIENKIWSLTSWYEHFANWKVIEDEKEDLKTDLKTLVYGTCHKHRLLDIIESFTLFDTQDGKIKKILAKYHQYYGVNKAIENVKNRKAIEWKLWVFWHTQWSWKSFSMMFFSSKVLRKLPGNFTFVIVTDRNELDKQIYSGFTNTGIVHDKSIRATSIDNLKELLWWDHRFIFTLIHKFQFRDDEEIKAINSRDDVIVITDEAHRSQYGELSMNMRLTLPNASFIWFTWTPLIEDEVEKTKKIFWDYVSVYNFSQSVQDGATVPIYYENRVPKLENINSDLESDLEKIIDKYSLDDDESEKIENEFKASYEILTRESRLETIAKDIVHHFLNRWIDGKAMVVCIDKKTTVRLYTKVQKYLEEYKQELNSKDTSFMLSKEKLRIEKQLRYIETLDIWVMLSLGNNQNEIDTFRKMWIDFKPIRERILKEDLETKFKDVTSNLKLIFVCSMWITWFDVPSITTLYLDKPLRNHTLMQTIARTNRVFWEKQNWLIVDYIWVFNNLRKALAIYASSHWNSSDDIVWKKEEIIQELHQNIQEFKFFLHEMDIDFERLLWINNGTKMLESIQDIVDSIFEHESSKKEFNKRTSKIILLYKSILPDIKAIDFQKTIKIITFLKSVIQEKWLNASNISQVKEELSDLLDISIASERFEIQARYNYKDLSQLPFDTLKDYFAKSKKHIEVENLKTAIEEKLSDMIRKNKQRMSFINKLNNIISEYNDGSKNVDDMFYQLLNLAREISEEDKRALQENLTEEELAIFDLLKKEDLKPGEEKEVKKASSELLEKLRDKLVLDWRKYEPKRADVEVAIEDYLFYNLPKSYDWGLIKYKSNIVYNHIFESYSWQGRSVYKELVTS